MMPTHKMLILKYMQEVGPITPLEALKEFGGMRLAARISDLKDDGYDIKTEDVSTINRYGRKVKFARYSLCQ